MHDKTNASTVSQGAQENESLQSRYDRAALALESNCFIIGMAPNSEALRRQNGVLTDEIKKIREEASQRGIVLLSPKRLL